MTKNIEISRILNIFFFQKLNYEMKQLTHEDYGFHTSFLKRKENSDELNESLNCGTKNCD